MTYEIDQWNDAEMMADELWCVLIGAVRGGVHRACFPTQKIVFSTGELLPVPLPTMYVISAEKLRFHRCTNLNFWVLAKHGRQRGGGRLC